MVKTLYRILAAIVPAVLFFDISCTPAPNQVVGSSADTEITTALVTIDTTYVAYSSLYARGKVKNTGTTQISVPWYVECQFYGDSTFSLNLGGNYTQITVPLDPGISTLWTITFSSSTFSVQSYPKFKVKDQRAIYKNKG